MFAGKAAAYQSGARNSNQHYVYAGSSKANGRELKGCLGRVINFKLGHFIMHAITWHIQACLSLELKTQPRFCPVS